MPGAESCAMDERTQFIGEWLEGLSPVVDLADAYGISRKTAYKWIGRYRAEGVVGLRERSSAPLSHGRSTPPELVAMIVAFKDAHRKWGPLKVIARLREQWPDLRWPSPSVAGEILKRAGLVDSTRGAAGGYALGRSPDEITLFDILRVVDPPEQTANDKLNPTVYVRNVRAVWDRVVESQQAILKQTSLADLVAQSEGLQYVI